jgi:ATP-dependent protease ClpP protease subunit
MKTPGGSSSGEVGVANAMSNLQCTVAIVMMCAAAARGCDADVR